VCVEPVPAFREAEAAREPGSAEGFSHQLRCVRHPIATLHAQPPGAEATRQSTALSAGPTACGPTPRGGEVLRVENVAKEFRTGWLRRSVKSVLRDVSFTLHEGERLGIMGPSGQGKTTLARVILGLEKPERGCVQLADTDRWLDISRAGKPAAALPHRVQMLYQDTDLVLDPAARVGDSIAEAYRVFHPRLSRRDCDRLAAGLLDELALPASMLQAYPYRLSGGERKRVALARSLAALGCPFPAKPDEPWRVLVLDEPTAGVDVVLQAVLARFLIWVQPRLRLCYLVISHDERFVRQFCDRALRLVNGHVVQ
jgi:ABC-type glutathione transport system ATPase component